MNAKVTLALFLIQFEKLYNFNKQSSTTFNHLEDCLSIKQQSATSQSGVYEINPDFQQSGVKVRCDMETERGGWIVS